MFDPFGIILSAGISWATGRILDALAECLRCTYTHPHEIYDKEPNHLSCPSCGNSSLQYVNICDYTFDEQSGRVGVAGIPRVWWESWGGLLHPSFEPHLDAWTLDLVGRDQVVRLELGELDGSIFYSRDHVVSSHHRYSRKEVWFSVPRVQFPRYSTTVAIDLRILSEYNDLLAERRKLMNYYY